jgi:hypothetical protein
MSELHHPRFAKLIAFLIRIPAVEINDTPSQGIGAGEEPDGGWWIKFSIDIDHDLAWHTVQEIGSVLNSLSLEEGMAVVFKPVSTPPYLNGGPEEFLSWVIEGAAELPPGTVAGMLEERLPQPVEDEDAWFGEPEEGDEDEDYEEETLEPDDEDEEGPFGSLDDD